MVSEVDAQGAKNADKQAEKGQGCHDRRVFPVFGKDDREDFQGKVEYGVDETGVECNAGHHGFEAKHHQRSRKLLGHYRFEVEFEQFMRVIEFLVAGFFAKPLGLALQHHRRVHFRHADERQRNDGEVDDGRDVFRPPPSQVRIGEDCSSDRRAQGRSSDNAYGVQ